MFREAVNSYNPAAPNLEDGFIGTLLRDHKSCETVRLNLNILPPVLLISYELIG